MPSKWRFRYWNQHKSDTRAVLTQKKKMKKYVDEVQVLPGGGMKGQQEPPQFCVVQLDSGSLHTTSSKSAKVYCDIRVVDCCSFVVAVVAAATAVCCWPESNRTDWGVCQSSNLPALSHASLTRGLCFKM